MKVFNGILHYDTSKGPKRRYISRFHRWLLARVQPAKGKSRSLLVEKDAIKRLRNHVLFGTAVWTRGLLGSRKRIVTIIPHRLMARSRSKYMPHQGAREKARRLRQWKRISSI